MTFKQVISVFDVIGPIMVGPSSSHTAGAVRLGKIGYALAGRTPVSAIIELHGSFAETATGHGTDKAILAGLLGLAPQDNRLINSPRLAKETGMQYQFLQADLGDKIHPNSCRITVGTLKEQIQFIGSSIGGGLIEIVQLNEYPVNFNGDLDCLIVTAQDQPGTVNLISSLLYTHNINVASLSVNRIHRGGRAIIVVQTDQSVPENLEPELRLNNWIQWVRIIPKILD